jgi:hypothetical protein
VTFEVCRGGMETTKDNEARLASLYDEYYGKIPHYAYVRIRDKTEAEDSGPSVK